MDAGAGALDVHLSLELLHAALELSFQHQELPVS